MVKSADFFWRPAAAPTDGSSGRSGVLLIHGLTGTPAEMRSVGKGLLQAGFTVHGVQLAGHCGDEADLLATGWRDWYRSVDEAATLMRQEVDHLFVAGLSMGAVLALELAIERPNDVQGLGLYGTTFKYDGWAIPSIARLSFLLPIACAMGIGRHRSFMESFPYGIKDERIRKRIVGGMQAGDSAAGGLPGNPWPSLAQFIGLSRHVRKRLGRVRAPCQAIHALNDDIASLKNVEIIKRHVSARVETVLLEDSYHMVTVDAQRDVLVERSAQFFAAIAAELNGPNVAKSSPQDSPILAPRDNQFPIGFEKVI